MIRQATYEDIPTLTKLVMGFFANGELYNTGLEPDPDTIEFFIEDRIEEPTFRILVADADGEIMGAIAGGIAPWMFNANIITLMELGWFVPQENRRKCARDAMQLKNDFYAWGRMMGATTLIMVSTEREESPRVIEMYQKRWGLRRIDSNFIGKL